MQQELSVHLVRDFILIGAAMFAVIETLKRVWYWFVAIKKLGKDKREFLDPIWWSMPMILCPIWWYFSHKEDLGWSLSLAVGCLQAAFAKTCFMIFQKMAKSKAKEIMEKETGK